MQYRYSVKEGFFPANAKTQDFFVPVNASDMQIKQKYMNMVRQAAVNSSMEQINKFDLQMFYTANMENVYYSKDMDCFVVAEFEDDTLLLQSIISENIVKLAELLQNLGGKYNKCRLGFTPSPEAMNICDAEKYDGKEDFRFLYLGKDLETIQQQKLYFPEFSHA